MYAIDYTIIGVYLSLMIFVGLWLQKKASAGIDSYFLGNRSIPWWVLGASGMSSNLDVTGTMINTALLFALGISGFFVEIRGGVTLVMAFLMIFMGKWNRRSEVMTLAEWMHLRFGKGTDGDMARIISAVSSIILTTAMVTYFCKGAGKFVAEFLGIPTMLGLEGDFWAALLMIFLAMIYTVASGLYGVVWTDLFQSFLIFGTIVTICFISFTKYDLPEKFKLSAPVSEAKLQAYNENAPDDKKLSVGSKLGEYELVKIEEKKYVVWETTKDEWTGAVPRKKFDFPSISEYSMFNLMGLLIFFYLVRVTMEGCGGTGNYMAQRFFAARNDREAGLLSLFWTFLLSFRWPFIAAIAIMGISFGAQQGVVGDPERVLPMVVNNLIPTGLKGLLVAGLMAAAMSTFDSTVNGGAAYWVKDIYQAYIKPNANEKDLMVQSRLASIGIVVIALIFSLTIKNINEIWAWITMGIGAGMFIPQIIRWYWWRLNGWGFAIGTAVGMVAAIAQKALLPEGTPEYVSFSIVISSSLLGTLLGTFVTPATEESVLREFYRKTRPFGLWGKVRANIPTDIMDKINRENRRDIIATFFAVPWQLILFMTWMMVIMRRWDQFAFLMVALVLVSIGLYLTWFRYLSEEVKIQDT